MLLLLIRFVKVFTFCLFRFSWYIYPEDFVIITPAKRHCGATFLPVYTEKDIG